jgi:arsenate reductase
MVVGSSANGCRNPSRGAGGLFRLTGRRSRGNQTAMDGFLPRFVTLELPEAEANGAATETHDGTGSRFMKRLLFVCVENSNRSQMAEAFARMHGAGRVHAASAGSKPSGRVNPKAVEAMRELGYDLSTHMSKGLGEFNGQHVDVAVTMGCGDECPLVLADRRVDWKIPDPRDMTPEQMRGVRDLIEQKVKELLASLDATP